MGITQIIGFLKEAEKFKTILRTCRTSTVDRAESDAEHTWHLVLLLMSLEDELKAVDFTKVIKLAMIHDLPEIYAGDTNPYRDSNEDKEEEEQAAAEKLFALLPSGLESTFMALFQEYVAQETVESQLVKSADKLMPLIQNLCTNASYSSYRKLDVTYDEAKTYLDAYFPSESILTKLYDKLLAEANHQGVFHNEH